MNALQTLISETMAAKGLRKAQIVSLLGFKNITKGIRRFDAFVADGVDFSRHARPASVRPWASRRDSARRL